jgi:hypothetical protein
MMAAIVFLGLLSGHLLGDWVAQTDWQATNKTRSRAALAAHVASYHLIMALLLLIPVLRNGWPTGKALAALTVSALTHGVIDRRWPVRAPTGGRQPRVRNRGVGRDRRRPGVAPVHPGHAGPAPRLTRHHPHATQERCGEPGAVQTP